MRTLQRNNSISNVYKIKFKKKMSKNEFGENNMFFFQYFLQKSDLILKNFSAAQKTLVVITDGDSILDTVDEPARLLHEAGVEVFSIGIGEVSK